MNDYVIPQQYFKLYLTCRLPYKDGRTMVRDFNLPDYGQDIVEHARGVIEHQKGLGYDVVSFKITRITEQAYHFEEMENGEDGLADQVGDG